MSRSTARKGAAQRDRKLLLWLLGCFPIGLVKMWRRSCRWPLAAKCAVTLTLALVVALILLPQTGPNRGEAGGIRFVGKERSVEVYGPELPAMLEENAANYEKVLRGSATSVPIVTPAAETYVYATTQGKFYHTEQCRYYSNSAYKFTLYEAHFSGYLPCAECNPPIYVPE